MSSQPFFGLKKTLNSFQRPPQKRDLIEIPFPGSGLIRKGKFFGIHILSNLAFFDRNENKVLAVSL